MHVKKPPRWDLKKKVSSRRVLIPWPFWSTTTPALVRLQPVRWRRGYTDSFITGPTQTEKPPLVCNYIQIWMMLNCWNAKLPRQIDSVRPSVCVRNALFVNKLLNSHVSLPSCLLNTRSRTHTNIGRHHPIAIDNSALATIGHHAKPLRLPARVFPW